VPSPLSSPTGTGTPLRMSKTAREKINMSFSFRSFPDYVEVDPGFPLLYRQFYVPSYFGSNDPMGKFVFKHWYVALYCDDDSQVALGLSPICNDCPSLVRVRLWFRVNPMLIEIHVALHYNACYAVLKTNQPHWLDSLSTRPQAHLICIRPATSRVLELTRSECALSASSQSPEEGRETSCS
jgi:hypothetical protein